ncbi:MAG: nucleotidyltransferase domain-containing protein [Asticcacaulis sp.]|uniref:nucleotidyltransferase domain-containing protein n=1 Tax=Asticcacaulis sp. TaxID=1872648 RepID=UPI003F7C1499
MGRLKSANEGAPLTACRVADHLLRSCAALYGFEAYMFGSWVTGTGSDIDILIIGTDGPALSRLQKEIRLAGETLPLDVLYMLPAEAMETSFVRAQKCIPLETLAAGYQASLRGEP